MKKYTWAIIIAMAGLSFSVSAQVKTSAQEVATPELAQKREALKEAIVMNYLGIKNSLVKSDSLQAIKFATEFALLLNQFKFKKLSLDEMNAATTTREEIKTLALAIAATKSINKQRSEMDKLSVKLWSVIERFKPEKTTLYKQVCPMTGTTWISDDKAIQNPYYPKNMLTCGEVKASI
jgi:Cu(I)/Ag(I) efflux system membrane fusion protein